jgi:hypothetical protein
MTDWITGIHVFWLFGYLLCFPAMLHGVAPPGVDMLIGIEVSWFVWSAVRRWRVKQPLLPHLRGMFILCHKPLCLVCLVHVLTSIWRAWMRFSTGACLYTVHMEDGGCGNMWVWWEQDAQQEGRDETQLPLIAFSGAGVGAAQYARFFQAASKTLGTTVVCLEDPSKFAMHQLYTFPPLSMQSWQHLYREAVDMICEPGDKVNMWSHSSGSFVAAALCHVDPPQCAVFYEPAALKKDWCTMDVTPMNTFWSRLCTWAVVYDECETRAMIRLCRDDSAEGLAKRACLLTSPLNKNVRYVVDTADSDHIFDSATARMLVPTRSPVQWESHSGVHGDKVALVDGDLALQSAHRLREHLSGCYRPSSRLSRKVKRV